MDQRSNFRKWAGTCVALCVAGLVAWPLGVHGQSSPDASFPPDTPASQQRDMRKPSGAGTGNGPGSRQRRLETDSYADSLPLTQKPLKIEPPHPLAAAYPNHNVIVCVAGCWPTSGPSIVFISTTAPTATAQASEPGPFQLVASAEAARAPSTSTVECLAGCVGPRPNILRSSSGHRQASAPIKLVSAKPAKTVKSAKFAKSPAAKPAKSINAKLTKSANRSVVR